MATCSLFREQRRSGRTIGRDFGLDIHEIESSKWYILKKLVISATTGAKYPWRESSSSNLW